MRLLTPFFFLATAFVLATALLNVEQGVAGLETNFVVLTTSQTDSAYLTDLLRLHGQICLTKNVFRGVDLFLAQSLTKDEASEAKSASHFLVRNRKHPSLAQSSEFQRLYEEQLGKLNAPAKTEDDSRVHAPLARTPFNPAPFGSLDAVVRLLDVLEADRRCKFWDSRIKAPKVPYEARGTVVDVVSQCPWRWGLSIEAYRSSGEREEEASEWKCSAQMVLEAIDKLRGVKVVFLTRRNSLDQVASSMDDAFKWDHGDKVDSRSIELNVRDLEAKLEHLVSTNKKVLAALAQLEVPHHQLFVEDLVEQPRAQVEKIADFLGISPYRNNPVPAADRLERPKDRSSLEPEDRFRNWPAINRALSQISKYRGFVDPKYAIVAVK